MSTVLLLAFRRWQNIDLILDECRYANIARVYIHIDAGTSVEAQLDVAQTFEKVSAYKERWDLDIRIATQRTNIGCAVSMILSLDEVFSYEDKAIVLEDDCLPTSDFFRFIEESFREMENNPQIGLACGAQFAPSQITQDRWLLSQYPFNWGWGITKSNWEILSSRMIAREKLESIENHVSREEAVYWNAGARRALESYTDVWDTLLVREMIRHRLVAILPSVNLVRNVGNDSLALHTYGEQLWTNFPTGMFSQSKSPPVFNSIFENWAYTQFFKISRRHLISTKVTWLLDRLFIKPKREPLASRIQSETVDFNLYN